MTSEALRHLVSVLRRQADSVEAALELAEAQTSAIVRRDLDAINRLSHGLEREVVEGRVLEERRQGFAAELASALGIDAGETTLSTIARALPAHEARKLMQAGETVIRAVERLTRQSAANRQLLENELTVIDQVVRIAHRGERRVYAGSGTYANDTIALLDARA